MILFDQYLENRDSFVNYNIHLIFTQHSIRTQLFDNNILTTTFQTTTTSFFSQHNSN